MNISKLSAWIFTWFDILLLGSLYFLGVFYYIAMDITFITHGIIALYVLTNILFFVMASNNPTFKTTAHKFLVWAMSLFPILGLFGTILGIALIMNNPFPDTVSIAELPKLFSQMLIGMSVAFYTTLAGIVTSILISFKLTVLNNE